MADIDEKADAERAEQLAAAGYERTYHDAVPIERIHPNPWNPNRMDDRVREATGQSLATYGFLAPIICRAHPEVEGDFQIIDGEHRWALAKDAGHATVPVVEVLELDDTAARKLTIIFNETRGEPNDVLLGTLLAEIKAEEGDGLGNALPYDQSHMEHLLSLAEADWPDYQAPDPGGAGDGTDADAEVATLVVKLGKDELARWKRAVESIDQETDLPDVAVDRNGAVVDVLVRAYLAE
jgi:ParB-like chromosome segregation protein Spo0J